MKWYELIWLVSIALAFVFEARLAYLDKAIMKIELAVFDASLLDERKGISSQWRWDVFKTVQRSKMFWPLWKPARSFWSHQTFDKPLE